MNIYKLCEGWGWKPGGEETLLKKFTRRSLTNYSTFITDSIVCENVEIIWITRAKVEFCLRFKK